MILQSVSMAIPPRDKRLYNVNTDRFEDIRVERLLIQVRTDLPALSLSHLKIGGLYVIAVEEGA